jgi:hypothetical protein
LLAETTKEEQETLGTDEGGQQQLASMVTFWVHLQENATVLIMEIDEAMSRALTTENKNAFGAGAKDDEDDDISIATDSARGTINVFTAESLQCALETPIYWIYAILWNPSIYQKMISKSWTSSRGAFRCIT